MPASILSLFKKPAQETQTVAEEAGRLFSSGFNCAQAVLKAAGETDDAQLLKMAKAFGGGICGSKCLCGAISGGVMALGLRDKGHLSGKLVAEFKEAFKVTCCSALSRPYVWKSREHLANCRAITERTAAITAKLLG